MVEQNSPVIFSDWLKLRRKALDMTQDELAKRAGCSVGALRKIESGERRPSKQLARLLAQALEIPNEDQQTFIRVARGELNLERLGETALQPAGFLPEIPSLQTAQGSTLPPKSTPPSNRIPLLATPLIGREAELAALERLFNDPQCRLLTLTGIGGIGKTRLALEFAVQNQAAFAGGVFYIPLSAVNSPEKIAPVIADVLGFTFSGPTDPQEQILSFISNHVRQAALFIFDNLEHLLAQAAIDAGQPSVVELVSEILQRSSKVKILGSSRERLNLLGEWTYELHGLSIPPIDYIGRLEAYDSVALFLKSAQRIKADFQATGAEQLPVIQICQLVEGVPLAIELAAAWVGMLSCREIAQEIQSNMDFLSTSMRDIPERHRSIRATFDHSWKLLSDEERWVLSQLSIFKGGFDRSAAQQIAGASLPLLASLGAKSLVHRTESGRYDLHEVIRQYARPHLNEDVRGPATYERHCEYYVDFVQSHEKALKSASQQEAIRELTEEIDNIRAAWGWAIDHKKYDLIVRASRGFGWYFEITGLYREGIEQLELPLQALKAGPQDDQQRTILGLSLIHRALLYFRKGEFEQARKLYEESILTLRPAGDQVLLADALGFLGTILHLQGEYVGARSSLEESLFLARQNNNRWLEAWAVFNLGHVEGLVGHYAQGYEQMLAGLAMWRAIGDPQSIALGLNFMVPTLNNLGRFEEAKAFMRESIALCELSKNRWGMGTAYRFLGSACLAGGQYEEAQVHLHKSLEIFGEYFVGWDIARSLAYLGEAIMRAGDFLEAKRIYQEAYQVSLEANAVPIALDVLAGISELQAQDDHPEFSLLLCYFILDHPAVEDETKSRAGQLCAVLESELSPEQSAAARAKARSTTLNELGTLVGIQHERKPDK